MKFISYANLICILLLVCNPLSGHSLKTFDPIVTDLKLLADTEPIIQQSLKKTLKEMPENTCWHKKTVPDLYLFFDNWLHYNPEPTTPFKFVFPFNELVYSKTGMQFIRLNKINKWLTTFFRERGHYIDSSASTKHLDQWIHDPRINIKQYKIPVGGYQSFNEFFTRSFKKGERIVEGPSNDQLINSPNDGSMELIISSMNSHDKIKAKGDSLNLKKIFRGHLLANRFLGGPVILSNLGIYDYHHYHSPVSGTIVLATTFLGIHDSGNSPAMYEMTYQHKRVAYIIQNNHVGLIGIVPIGFWMVNSVRVNKRIGDYVHKGDELGYFAYGGSAILLFFEPGKVTFTRNFCHNRKIPILMGESFAKVSNT